MSADRGAAVAIVTGGARGIGRAVVTRLLQRGYAVTAFDLDRAEELREHHAGDPGLLVRRGDVADEAAVAAAVAATVERFGRLTALVNNAGIGDTAPLAELTLERWRRVIDTNLTGAFLFARHAAPHLRLHGGAIVNIASTRALMSEPDTEAYAASKGGLVALTHALAVSLGPAVRVNTVSPGWIEVSRRATGRPPPELRPEDHSQHPVGRVGRPADVAALVDYLLSDEAGFVTGQNLVIDGGMTRKMIYRD